MDMARYFVTADGLRAALLNDRVLHDFTRILTGEAPATLVARYRRQGLVDEDRRPSPQVDHNALVLSGTVERIRELLTQPTNGHPPATTPAEPPAEDDDLRTRPRRLYRPAPTAASLTADQLRGLPSGARRVLRALRRSKVATTRILSDATGLNRRTVENALSRLRAAGLIETEELR
jgi:hypothetical protein